LSFETMLAIFIVPDSGTFDIRLAILATIKPRLRR